LGIRPRKCVDDEIIQKAFRIQVNPKKDPTQRAACACIVNLGIDMQDTRLPGCWYWFATQSSERARAILTQHEPISLSSVGRDDATPEPPGQRNLCDK
jgi:hypothetical protein